ncbi:Uncharacterised protein [Candidatus Gugararchaeum adminiculabundum]|nr:Uncharacterised protein [Candidatus Gugararchaeum adminiculabundum]
MAIEDEIIHWWKDEKGENHRNALRVETDDPTEQNGFPRDGQVTVRLMNTVGNQAIKLNPDEALRVSTILLSAAKELINKKRVIWRRRDEE